MWKAERNSQVWSILQLKLFSFYSLRFVKGLKKRAGGDPDVQENSRLGYKNNNSFSASNEAVSPPQPPLEKVHPIIPTNNSFTMWTHRQFQTGPPRFPTFQIRKQEDGEMEKFKIFGLYESMMMNFIETVAETDIPMPLNLALQVSCMLFDVYCAPIA